LFFHSLPILFVGTERISALSLTDISERSGFSKTASQWQTALVKNISFNIILLSEKGVTFMHSAKFIQPISFGMPTTQMTIKEVVAKYGRVKVSEMIVEQYFKERLLINYPMVTSGGRVNWTTTENLPVTDYETTFMLPDGCQ
jgi:sulfur relay (sulfurtransferase) DsrC/TusE family protein